MDEQEPQPYDASSSAVAAAQAQLEVARRSGRTGAIAFAMLNLAATLAALGDHPTAVTEYRRLVDYLALAGQDAEAAEQRTLRMLSPAAPPPGPDDVDPVAVQAVARIQLAESLLALGRRDEARLELDAAAPATKGWGRGPLRRRLAEVRRQFDAATHHEPDESVGVVAQVAAADELLAAGRADEAARVALTAISRCSPDERLVQAQARQVLGMALEALGQPHDALTVLTEAYRDYLAADDYGAAAHVAIALAWRRADRGDRAGAADLLRQALTAIEGQAGPAVRVQLFVDLGSVLDADGHAAEARAALDAGVTTARELADRGLTADAQHGLAIVLSRAAGNEDKVEALALLDDSRRRYDELGLADRAAGCEHEAAALLGRLGSIEPAANRYRLALQRYRDLPEDQRDTGTWPDEIADCETNLQAIEAAAADPELLRGDPRLFRSGGHAMSHRR